MPDQPTPARTIARVEIDRELCIGAASCMAVAPTGFELDGEQKAVTKPGWELLTDEELLNAAKACPVAAIYMYDQAGQRMYPE